MKDAKDFGGRGAGEGGRYSDAARHIDPPMTSQRGGSSTYGGFEPVEVEANEWENFTYQPTGAAPQVQAVSAAPRAAVAPGSLPRGIRGSGDADRQIDEALLGLSMPARPRNTNPAKRSPSPPRAMPTTISSRVRRSRSTTSTSSSTASSRRCGRPGPGAGALRRRRRRGLRRGRARLRTLRRHAGPQPLAHARRDADGRRRGGGDRRDRGRREPDGHERPDLGRRLDADQGRRGALQDRAGRSGRQDDPEPEQGCLPEGGRSLVGDRGAEAELARHRHGRADGHRRGGGRPGRFPARRRGRRPDPAPGEEPRRRSRKPRNPPTARSSPARCARSRFGPTGRWSPARFRSTGPLS